MNRCNRTVSFEDKQGGKICSPAVGRIQLETPVGRGLTEALLTAISFPHPWREITSCTKMLYMYLAYHYYQTMNEQAASRKKMVRCTATDLYFFPILRQFSTFATLRLKRRRFDCTERSCKQANTTKLQNSRKLSQLVTNAQRRAITAQDIVLDITSRKQGTSGIFLPETSPRQDFHPFKSIHPKNWNFLIHQLLLWRQP